MRTTTGRNEELNMEEMSQKIHERRYWIHTQSLTGVVVVSLYVVQVVDCSVLGLVTETNTFVRKRNRKATK